MRTLTFNRLVGSGAMGSVYHAELRVPGGFARTCAVKVMKRAASDKVEFLTRMRDEARLLGMLQDESLLGVSELVKVEGQDAVIMEFVEGVDLADIVSGTGGVPARALAELGAEIAATLHRAHAATHPTTGVPLGVIHRDIKPANVMVTLRGGVKLLDFGVARAAFDARESETQGLVLGTLNYFAPEILAGKDPTPAVDIYGLGITLWECAAAREWGSPRVQVRRFHERVETRLGELPPDFASLVPVIRGLLAWNPQDRPSGRQAEQQLLQAAEAAGGQALRTWSREVVPKLLAAAEQSRPRKNDPLVGKTLSVDGFENAGAAPEPQLRPAGFGSEVTAPIDDVAPQSSRAERKVHRRGPSTPLLIMVGALLGGTIGLAGLAVVAVVLFML